MRSVTLGCVAALQWGAALLLASSTLVACGADSAFSGDGSSGDPGFAAPDGAFGFGEEMSAATACGNRIIEPGEECEGGHPANLKTCAELGLQGGRVSCNGFTCELNTEQCGEPLPAALPEAALAECPADLSAAHGRACSIDGLQCFEPNECGGMRCVCLPTAAEHDAEAGTDSDAGTVGRQDADAGSDDADAGDVDSDGAVLRFMCVSAGCGPVAVPASN